MLYRRGFQILRFVLWKWVSDTRVLMECPFRRRVHRMPTRGTSMGSKGKARPRDPAYRKTMSPPGSSLSVVERGRREDRIVVRRFPSGQVVQHSRSSAQLFVHRRLSGATGEHGGKS